MYIGRVTGNVVATVKDDAFLGQKLLIVDRVDLHGHVTNDYNICVDHAQAGIGDNVLVLDEGTGARQILQKRTAPIRSIIVGIIDTVDLP